MDFLSQLLGFGGSAISSGATGISSLISLLMNQGRYDEGNQLFNRFNATQVNPFVKAAQSEANKFQAGGALDPQPINDAQAAGAHDLLTGSNAEMSGLRDRVLGLLKGQGDQEIKDINKTFTTQGDTINADLASRGLGGTTAGVSALGANSRNWADSLGAAKERIAGNQANADTTLTGAVNSNANSLWNNYFSTLGNNYNRSVGGSGNFLSTMGTGLSTEGSYLNNRLGWISGVSDPYPSQANNLQLSQSLGSGAAGPVNYPSPDNSGAIWGGGIGAAGGIAGGIAAGTIIAAGFCIDLEADIAVPGRKGVKLKEIKDRDWVYVDGQPRLVLIAEQCRSHPEKLLEYLQICTNFGNLKLSKDHIVGGRPAGDWRIGDSIEVYGKPARIASIAYCDPFPSGDLLLANIDEYVVNGFVVKSMFSVTGETVKSIKEKRNQLVVG